MGQAAVKSAGHRPWDGGAQEGRARAGDHRHPGHEDDTPAVRIGLPRTRAPAGFSGRGRRGGSTCHTPNRIELIKPLRRLANRLTGILHGCLKTRTLYDEDTAWGHRT